jgi:hypothetical protein
VKVSKSVPVSAENGKQLGAFEVVIAGRHVAEPQPRVPTLEDSLLRGEVIG